MNAGLSIVAILALLLTTSNSSAQGPKTGPQGKAFGLRKVTRSNLNRLPNSSEIRVQFRGQTVGIQSTRDVSNVVLQYSDGAKQKFDDLQGRKLQLTGTGIHAGKLILRAWIKSGPNFSGDGPGYGQRFEKSDSTDSAREKRA